MADRFELLQRVTLALAGQVTFEDIASTAIEQIAMVVHAQAGAMLLLREGALHLMLSQGYPPEQSQQWQQIPQDADVPVAASLRNNEPLWIESSDEARQRFPDGANMPAHHQAWAVLPLHRSEGPIGVLLLSFAEARSFPPEERGFLLVLVQQCGLALERAFLYEAEHRARLVAEEAMQRHNHMVSLISHDLKTPLATIQNYTYLLQQRLNKSDTPDLERIAQGLENIAETTRRMVTQVGELLDIASFQAGKPLHLKREPHELAPLVERVIATYQRLSHQHTLHLEVQDTTMVVQIDVMRLERVLGNLLSNAIKYSPDGRVVQVSIARQQHEGQEWASISVQDEGIGIPADELPTIFAAFQRGSSTRGTFAGTGLGLASARQIMDQHGGTITVASEVGVGSTFTIWLPLV